jgi:hypothetical protein
MTHDAQQPELTEIIGVLAITEGFVPTAIRSEVMRLRERLEEFDRSRPHTPALEQHSQFGGQMTDHQIRSDLICMTARQRDELIAEAARAATLKTLDTVKNELCGLLEPQVVNRICESLRQQEMRNERI